MKFSFRYLLAIIIFLSILALATQQVLLDIKSNPNKSVGNAIIGAINPFWQSPNIFEASKKSIKIPVTVDNPTDSAMMVTGKIELSDEQKKPIPKIGIIGETKSSS